MITAVWAGDKPELSTYEPALNECTTQLLTYDERVGVIRDELNRLIKETDGFTNRQTLRLFKRPLVSQVLETCHSKGACSAADFIQATNEIVENLFARSHKLRTYSKLVALNIGIAMATTFATNALPPKVQTLTTFITVFVSNAAWEFIAPIAEPSLGKLRQKVFRSVERNKRKGVSESQSDHNQVYEDVLRSTQANLTPWAQWGRATVNSFLTVAMQRTASAHQAMMLYPDRAKAQTYAADQLADVMFFMRTAFKDIPPTEADIARAIKTSFIDHIDDPRALANEVLDRLKERDPNASSPGATAYYEIVLRTWFGL